MATKFIVVGAKVTQTKVPCTYGAGEEWACSATERCGYCEDGLEDSFSSDCPEAEFSVLNAPPILRTLGVTEEDHPYGGVTFEGLPDFRRRIVLALNKDLSPLAKDFTMRPGNPTVFSMGVTEESMARRYRQLDEVCVAAQERGSGIRWY